VNVSPQTLADPRLGAVLDPRYADRTIVEVTEHAKVADYASCCRSLAALKRRGVALAIDDAGAGYSGLQHILQLAPDYIKMDMSLTRSLTPTRRAARWRARSCSTPARRGPAWSPRASRRNPSLRR
jgi:EAL domain-containing protein (putative c-di-GMP-specific phosphodiesterase class I)